VNIIAVCHDTGNENDRNVVSRNDRQRKNVLSKIIVGQTVPNEKVLLNYLQLKF